MGARAIILNLYPPPLLKASSSSSTLKRKPPPPRYHFNISCSIISRPSSSSSSLSSSDLNNNLSQIQSSGVIACLRAPTPELAIGAAHAALDSGISVLEVVVTCPGVFEVIQELVRVHPTKTIGVGTVLNAEDAKRAIQSGAQFLMSPAIVQDVFEIVQGTQVLYIPGAMTPTEILFAYNAGAKIVKVYPVSAIGGAQYIRALRKPFPHIPIVASQGITIDSAPEYIGGGASAVLLSDAIFDKKAVSQGDYKTISKLASRATLLGNEAVMQLRLAQ